MCQAYDPCFPLRRDAVNSGEAGTNGANAFFGSEHHGRAHKIVTKGAVRLAGPSDRARTGAIAGLTASAISVTAFALRCTIDPAPFVGLWFGATGILCMLSGAKLGAPAFYATEHAPRSPCPTRGAPVT